MRYFVRVISLALTLFIMLMTIGCKKSSREAYIYFELPNQPSTLDPQTASSDSELLIVRNIYEGLLRKNESGAVVCGVAQSYEQNGLTYSFTLRNDTVWSNGEPVTAYDFVFALRRALEPKTESPFASKLYCISNAESVHSGALGSENLGVTAVDEHNLIITLSSDDPDFTETLTTPVAMPCNEKFFNESVGKYGLTAETILSNGSYSLKKWNKDTFGIRLYKSNEYEGSFKPSNAAVFLTCNDEETPLSLLKDNNVDMALIDPADTDEAKNFGLKTVSFQNICWVLTISQSFSDEMRTSLAKLVGSNVYEKSLKCGYYAADSLFPKEYGAPEAVKAYGVTAYDLEGGKQLFANAVARLEDKKFPSSVKLYYYDDGNVKSAVTDIVGHWQNNLGAYINIERASASDLLLPELKNQSYDMAIFPVTANDNTVKNYLNNFGIDYNGEDLAAVQASILNGNRIIPLFFEDSVIAYTDSLSSVYTECGNGFVDFSFIIKTE